MSQDIQMKTKAQMRIFQLTCQNCHKRYKTMKDFKAHVRSYSHKQQVALLFKTALHKGPVFLPMLVVLDHLRVPDERNPLIGLDMVTFCITPEKCGAFYLCHVCEEQLSSQHIMDHLFSFEHYFKYLAYSNPEFLHFAWLKDSFSYLQTSALKENRANGPGTLRVFELPKMMLKKGKKLTYQQVMEMFSKTETLTESVQAQRPKRKTLQDYITNPARTNPLLGLNFLLEYSCPENEWHCGYLCILCKKKLPATESISHCISFDHVYYYLEEAHPASLECPKSSYTHYSYSFHKKIFYLANQAQKENPPGEIQCVHLDSSCFKEIVFSNYTSALDKLQLKRQERNQSEFTASVVSGERISYTQEAAASPACLTATESSSEKKAVEKPTGSGTDSGNNCQYVFCVQCDQTLSSISDFKFHIKGTEHKAKFYELFGSGLYNGPIPEITLYQYLSSSDMKSAPPLIGLQLLTVLVDRQAKGETTPIYLCHACEFNISTSASVHLASPQHYYNFFAHTKPDLLLLGTCNLDRITSYAQDEESKRKKDVMVLRVCEIPSQLWRNFKNQSYEKIMATIWKHFSKLSPCFEVQKRETLQTYTQSCERKSPIVGLQFIVKYSTTLPYPKCGYLCLLCEKKLSEMEAIAHVLSFSHVFSYLNLAHPGSLSKNDENQKSLVIDLAQQAEKINPDMALRQVELDFGKFHEINTSTFNVALDALQLYFGQKDLEELKPFLVPGARLVSSLEKKHAECVERRCISTSDTGLINLDPTHAENSAHKANSLPPHLQPNKEPLKINSANLASNHIEQGDPSSITTEPSLHPEASLHIQQEDPMELDTEHLRQALPPCKNKQQTAITSQPQETSFAKECQKLVQNQKELLEFTQNQRQSPNCLKNKEQPVPQSSAYKEFSLLWNYLKTTNREPVIGLSSLIEFHTDGQPPFYLCVPCTERVKEISIIGHLTSRDHRMIYLKSINYAPLLAKRKFTTKWLRKQAFALEMREGYGQAQIVLLDSEDYSQTMYSPILNVLGKLRDSLVKLTSEITDESTMPALSSDSSKCDGRQESSDEGPIRTSPHLWSYLTSPNRKEPVIGLSMVTEFRTSSGQNSFLCSGCNVILPTSKYMCHLISPRHRYIYIKDKHPDLVEMWKGCIDFTSKITDLQVKAKIVQDSEGWGCLKVVEKESQKQKERSSKIVDHECATKAQEPETSQNCNGTVLTGQECQKSQRQQPTKKKKKKMNKRNVLIGLNFVTCVTHGGMKLFFCELCSERCYLDHMSSVTHQKFCLEQRYPGWTSRHSNLEKLDEITLHIAAVERCAGIEMKKLHVSDQIFTALKTAPICEALSLLKLQQTKLEDGVNLRGSPASPEPKSSTASDCTNAGNNVNVKDHSVCSPAAIKPICFQQEQTPVLEKSVTPSEISDSFSGSPKPPLEPCSAPSVPVSFLSTSPIPCSPTSDIYTANHCSSVSSPPLVPCNTSNTSVPLPPLSPSIPDQPPLSFSSIPLASVPDLPPLSCQPVITSQSQSSPPQQPLNDPSISSLPLYEPISPPTLYEPISLQSAPDYKATPCIVPSASACSPAASSQNSVSPIALLHLSQGRCVESENQAYVCTQSILTKETRPQFTAPPHFYRFLNLSQVGGQSNAYIFLKLRNLLSTQPIIGLSNILECRSTARPTFFLCLNCAEKISTKNFCYHMTSERHQHISIMVQYPRIFQEWQGQTSLTSTIRDLAKILALMEQGLDAKVIKLDQKQYESVESADFISAIEMLQTIYGPEQSQSSLPLHFASPSIREIFAARLLQEYVETARETHRYQPQQSCDINPSQSQHRPGHLREAAEGGFDCMQGSIYQRSEVNNLTRNLIKTSESSQKTTKDSEKEAVQARQTLHQFISQKSLSTETNSRNTGLHSSKTHTESTLETPVTGHLNPLELQSSQTPNKGLTEITIHSSPVMCIKQEKPDFDEGRTKNTGCLIFSPPLVPQLSCGFGTPSPKEPTGNQLKHTEQLKKYINSKRKATDAIVGLSSLIVCQSEGQAPLYFCVPCSSKLDHDLIINHLLKPGHRESHLRHRYPWLFDSWSDSDTRTQKSLTLMQLAYQVEQTFEDEPGQLQEIEVECASFKEIKDLSFDKAIAQLQKIRKEQNLCALQTYVSPKMNPVLVKQENVETALTTPDLSELADLPDMNAQRPRTATKRTAAQSDSSCQALPLFKQIKLLRTLSSSEDMPRHPRSWMFDLQTPSPPSPQNPTNSVTPVMYPSESLPQNQDKAQNTSHNYVDLPHVSLSSSETSATRPIEKYSCHVQKPTTSNKASQESLIKATLKSSGPDTPVILLNASDPLLLAQKPLDFCSDKPAKQSESVVNCLKRQRSESEAPSLLSGIKHYPSSQLQPSPLLLNIPDLSEIPVKRRCTDNLVKPAEEHSNLSIGLSDTSQISLSNSSDSSYPRTRTETPSYLGLHGNSNGQSLSIPIGGPQQKPPCTDTGAHFVETQGQSIARLHERPLIKRSSENSWNYENRQFSPDTPDTKQVAALSSETNRKMPAKTANISAYACNDNSAISYSLPAHDRYANLYFPMSSGCGRTTSLTSSVIPRYNMPYPYHDYKQSDYQHAPAIASYSAIANNYAAVNDESAINTQTGKEFISADVRQMYITDTTSDRASQQVYQSQQVFQPIQYFQSLEEYQAYCAFYAYNQPNQPN
ncbi:uncharacterized protein [Hoplias malabaricus]|uniref:uncharacterized protein isoform X2 n=1 Tax=Hoplias malabaricus TaxID=27720 RepID=UPI00346211C4